MKPATVHPAAAKPSAEAVRKHASESGYVLLGVLILVACFSISLAVAVPQIARSIQRDREEETIQRGKQYTRAIRLFYKKFGKYPSTMEELMNSTNGRYLRKRYLDPITGKDDWKLIHLGEAKVPSLGFFGIPATLGSPIAANAQGAPGQSVFAQSAFAQPVAQPVAQQGGSTVTDGSPSQPSASSGDSSSVFGAGFGTASPSPGSSPAASQPTALSASSNNSLGAEGGIVIGQIVGVGIPLDKKSLLRFRKQANYNRWEFVYDPIQERQAIPNANSINGAGKGSTDSNSVPLSATFPDGSDPKLTPQPDPNLPPN